MAYIYTAKFFICKTGSWHDR